MGGSSSGSDPNKYYATEEQVICMSPVDSILAIEINDEVAYSDLIGSNKTIYINKPKLFGGKSSEGGVQGYCEVRFGKQDQGKSECLASKITDTILSATRGVVSIVMKDFYLGQNPYAKPWIFRVQSTNANYDYTENWYAEKASIVHGGTDALDVLGTYQFNGKYPHLSSDKNGNIIGFFLDDNFGSVQLKAYQSVTIDNYNTELEYKGRNFVLVNNHVSLYEFNVGGNYGTQSGFYGVNNRDIVFNVNKYIGNGYFNDKSGLVFQGTVVDKGFIAVNGESLGNDYSVGDFFGNSSTSYISKMPNEVYISLGTVALNGDMADGYGGRDIIQLIDPISLHIDTSNVCVYMDKNSVGYVLDCITKILTMYEPNDHKDPDDTKDWISLEFHINSYVLLGEKVMCFFANKEYNVVYIVVKNTENEYFIRSGDFNVMSNSISINPLPSGVMNTSNCYFVNGADYIYLFMADYGFKVTKLTSNFNDTQVDYNPIHAIREVITSKYWGLGKDESFINDTNFKACADKLYDENLGISFVFESGDKVTDFIQDVLEIIGGTVRVNRSTGKLEVKLARKDYNTDDLLVFDKSNIIEISDIQRTALSECINQVTVKYTNFQTGENSSVVYQDLALLQQLGEVNNTDIETPYIYWSDTANAYAQRKLDELSTPYLSCEIKVNSTARDLNLYDVVIVNMPNLQINNMVFRIIKMSIGSSKDNEVTLTLTQDKFTLPTTTTVATSTIQNPTVNVKNDIPQRLVVEAPYYCVYKKLGLTLLNALINNDTHASKLATLYTMYNSSLVTSVENWVNVSGSSSYVLSSTTKNFLPSCTLNTSLDRITDNFAFSNDRGLSSVNSGDLIFCDDEIMTVGKIDTSNNSISVGRGCLDTMPTEHIKDAVCIIVARDNITLDQGEYGLETINVKLLPISDGTITINSVQDENVTFNSRLSAPYPIANVKINNAYFPSSLSVDNYTVPFSITFNTRNRLLQISDSIISWYSPIDNELESDTVIVLSFFTKQGTLIKDQEIINNVTLVLPYDIEDYVNINIQVVRSGMYYNYIPYSSNMVISNELPFDTVYNNGVLSVVTPLDYPIELALVDNALTCTTDENFKTTFEKKDNLFVRNVEK